MTNTEKNAVAEVAALLNNASVSGSGLQSFLIVWVNPILRALEHGDRKVIQRASAAYEARIEKMLRESKAAGETAASFIADVRAKAVR